jgi:hypothetical protein
MLTLSDGRISSQSNRSTRTPKRRRQSISTQRSRIKRYAPSTFRRLIVVKSLQEELQRANSALVKETSQNEVLSARLTSRSQAATAQLREELHSDLSGLIFRNVERVNGNTVFDCLQIGRNGSTSHKLIFCKTVIDGSVTLQVDDGG